MELPLALNSLLYIIIFLFPGILFRKFYFRGEFSKQFHQGNLFERFLWTLLYSFIVIILSSFIIGGFGKIFNTSIFNSVEYDKVKTVLETINNNGIPLKEDLLLVYKSSFIYLSLLLMLSMAMGFLSHTVVYFLRLDIRYSPFRYRNNWHYIIRGNFKKTLDNEYIYFSTDVEVLTEIDGQEVVYSGNLDNYYIDHTTNKLETIILSDVKKHYDDYKTNYSLNSHTLAISKENIKNLSFKYFYINNVLHPLYQKYRKIIGYVLFRFIIVPSFIAFLYSSSIHSLFKFNYVKAASFLLFSWIFLIILVRIILDLIRYQAPKTSIRNICLLAAPVPLVLWSLSFLQISIAVFLMLIVLLFTSIISIGEDAEDKEGEGKK